MFVPDSAPLAQILDLPYAFQPAGKSIHHHTDCIRATERTSPGLSHSDRDSNHRPASTGEALIEGASKCDRARYASRWIQQQTNVIAMRQNASTNPIQICLISLPLGIPKQILAALLMKRWCAPVAFTPTTGFGKSSPLNPSPSRPPADYYKAGSVAAHHLPYP